MTDKLDELRERYFMLEDERTLLDLEIEQAKKELIEELGANDLSLGESVLLRHRGYYYAVEQKERRNAIKGAVEHLAETTIGRQLMAKGIVSTSMRINWSNIGDLNATEQKAVNNTVKITKGPLVLNITKIKKVD